MRLLRYAAILALAATLSAVEPSVTAANKLLAEGKFDDAITQLDKARAAKPKSSELTKALSAAYAAKGDSLMNNAQLPPMRKYPDALRAFRKAVETDKTNTKAAEAAAMIEGIYKQMGRPVPQ